MNRILLVAQDDVDTANIAETNLSLLNNGSHAEYLDKLARSIDGYNVDAVLETLAGKLDITLQPCCIMLNDLSRSASRKAYLKEFG